ncbi:serine/threonine-protein kinase [Spirillospora sp. CA-294931]|uniref:serine/threonine-protein kinase n=1 Tax=Spirillospora sp. CA-294931 TaxID=3240042 RepID=UPI003D8FD942
MEPGLLLDGKYRLDTRLGRGGMGEVWAARDEHLARPVAIKIVLADLHTDAALVARLRQEARTAAGLQHPGITVVHDIGEHDGHPYFVMELLDGVDFTVLVAAHSGGMPVEVAVGLMVQVADALAHAHDRGVVHRDVKPANLMRLAGGGVKVCDFGIARYAEATDGVTGPGLGTPAFMAPEQWLGEQVDARTDLYAFGATLHTLLTGAPPFPGPAPAALMRQHLDDPPPHLRDRRPDLPGELGDLLQRLLAKSPADRPADTHQVKTALQAVSTAQPAKPDLEPPTRPLIVQADTADPTFTRIEHAARNEPVPGPKRPPRKFLAGPLPALALLTAVIAAVGLATAVAAMSDGERPDPRPTQLANSTPTSTPTTPDPTPSEEPEPSDTPEPSPSETPEDTPTPTPAKSTRPPQKPVTLGGLALDRYCIHLGWVTASYTSGGYDWFCAKDAEGTPAKRINLTDACQWEYSNPRASARWISNGDGTGRWSCTAPPNDD